MTDIRKQAEAAAASLEVAKEQTKALEVALEAEHHATRKQLDELLTRVSQSGRVRVDDEDLDAFLKRPWISIPAGREKWRVIAPRWVDFHVGIVEWSTPSYNVFLVDRFTKWLGQLPEALAGEFEFKAALDAIVEGGMVHVPDKATQEEIWKRHSQYFTRRDGDRAIYVKEGSEFDLIAELIDHGTLPWRPKPVHHTHLYAQPIWHPGRAITLRDYQAKAWQRFLQLGAIGLYWPYAGGKSFFGVHAAAHVEGPKLVVVSTTTLVEQWQHRLQHHLLPGHGTEVITYQGFEKIRDRLRQGKQRGYRLIMFDECHRLPANTFSKFATIPGEYRIGMSATPYREDGRTDYIFALTGFPIGLDWADLMRHGIVQAPDVHLHLSAGASGKFAKLQELLATGKRTVVFCDGLERGHDLARRTGLPFIHGGTSKRLEKINEAKQVILSRVGDEGLSLPDLEQVVEYDFLFGSRRQEGQRMGRLFHATDKGDHWILMTNDEHDAYSKRLDAVREKGIRIRVHREAS